MTADQPQANDHSTDTGVPRRSRTVAGWVAAVLFVVAGLAALAIDCPVSHWCRDHSLPGDLQTPIDWAELFGHGLGATILLLVVLILDPGCRRAVLRLALMAYGAGMTANLLKAFVARTRPRVFDFHQGVFESFGRLSSFNTGGSDFHSFPSAHVALAVALAIGLGRLYPRGRVLFLVFAAMVAAQRITHCAHFPSDTLFGAAIGCLIAWLLLDVGPVARWLDKWETLGFRIFQRPSETPRSTE
jgi:membrane-associated phospholipid phosphatase